MKNVNWHSAACDALRIDLEEYSDFLEYETEHVLGKRYYQIDLIIIRKLFDVPIQKVLAQGFRNINIFEIKGIGSSTTIRSFYKTLGYACQYIDLGWKENRYTAEHITVNLLSRRKPKELMKHLRKIGLVVQALEAGIYAVTGGVFRIFLIVTRELAAESYLFLHCLTNHLGEKEEDGILLEQLAERYRGHTDSPPYENYAEQLIKANLATLGGTMDTEQTTKPNLFVLFNQRLDRYKQQIEDSYRQQIEDISRERDELAEDYDALASKNAQLVALLAQNGISVD